MNREIKFRAFDKKLNMMVTEGFHVIGEVTMFSLIDQHIHEHKQEGEDSLGRLGDIEIMQYTGLKDSIGKEIYEGDIVHCKEYGEDRKGIIKYWNETSSFNIEWLSQTEFNNTIHVRIKNIQVIGNIYEYPYLLT